MIKQKHRSDNVDSADYSALVDYYDSCFAQRSAANENNISDSVAYYAERNGKVSAHVRSRRYKFV